MLVQDCITVGDVFASSNVFEAAPFRWVVKRAVNVSDSDSTAGAVRGRVKGTDSSQFTTDSGDCWFGLRASGGKAGFPFADP